MHAMVVRRGAMLRDVFPLVCWSRTPVISELLLQPSAPYPVETHVNYFGALWMDSVCDNTQCCCIVRMHRHGWLWVSHLLERVVGRDCFS